MFMKIISVTFEHGAMLPGKYTCDGENTNPPLLFQNIPTDTRSLVLIMTDPDVPTEIRSDRNWNHWIVFNIPPDVTSIKENSIPEGSVIGISSGGKVGYEGPCPPSQLEPNRHRYFFKLYALDNTIDLTEGSTRQEVEDVIKDHVIESAELMGVYKRNE